LTSGGFESWKRAQSLDGQCSLQGSKQQFEEAAKEFFDEASGDKLEISRAFYEYSTLMDALALVQEGRSLRSKSSFDDALNQFVKASEIMRATVHFGFLASYVSGCASLETAIEMEDDEEKFQGFKNSIALMEQSKLALSFRDDRHPLLRSINALVKFAISRALLVESQMLKQTGSEDDSKKKKEQSQNAEEDFLKLTDTGESVQASRYRVDYLLGGYECKRAMAGPLLVGFPEKTSLWIGNVGKEAALVETLGKSTVDKIIPPFTSLSWPMTPEFRGRLRITYKDVERKGSYDEGCLTVI